MKERERGREGERKREREKERERESQCVCDHHQELKNAQYTDKTLGLCIMRVCMCVSTCERVCVWRSVYMCACAERFSEREKKKKARHGHLQKQKRGNRLGA